MGPLRPRQSPKDADFFDNIIIDTRGAAILPSLTALRHRIDRRTTICLLHPGLGLVEQLIEQVFDDPLQRPNFVLGHSTHKLSKVRDIMFSMKQRKPGALYLYGVPKFEGSTFDKSSLVYEGMRQSQHLVQLLSSTECLNVVGLPWVRFLSWKLPTLIFTSLADTISVALGCKYQEIYHNHHARIMWDSLLEETLAIISQFPELQEVPHRIHYFTAHSFRRKLQMYLAAQRANISPWIKQVKMGNNVPVDYFNGYFVQRARELGLTHEYNSMAVEIVKARVSARQTELRSDLRFRVPYMTDTDLIGGGQPIPSLEDTLELELEGF
ncbi:hypothetical protein NUW58_g4279 [Xylaria curta]|uniref:Uncharacterized protein n=1 Tax=Xylaria curta TaxID=42375 RepID=A0ACC1P769_9PEZI|nr:hypothetical protein NUW58_g4279 [Xylaria curta]